MKTPAVSVFVRLPRAQIVESINEVLKTIFEAADVPTLKRFREISSRWHFFATQQLRQEVTIRLCFYSLAQNLGLKELRSGRVCLRNTEQTLGDPYERLVILRKSDNPFDPRPSSFTVLNLIRAMRKNPRGFPCVSFEITTQFLASKYIKHFLQCVGTLIRRLKLVLHYFFRYFPCYSSFEDTLIRNDLRKLLLFRTPHLQQFHLIARLPKELSSQVLTSKLDSTKNFLDDEERFGGPKPRARRFLTLKSFTYEGLLPRQIAHDIIQASVNLRKVNEIESAGEFAKRVEAFVLQPYNPYFKQLLERTCGKYTGKICSLSSVSFERYLSESDAYPPYVQLYNDIMECHAQTLTHMQFKFCNFCDKLRIPAMSNLKELQFTRGYANDIKVFPSSQLTPDECEAEAEATVCQVACKFPKLELIRFPNDFNFGAHFALRLSVDPSGPFSSIKSIQTTGDCAWDVIDSLCTQMSELFPRAEMCIGENPQLLPAFRLSHKPPLDPRVPSMPSL